MAESSRLNWFQRLALKAAGFPTTPSRSLSLTDPTGWEGWGAGTYSGKMVDENAALQVSTVWACVRILAETIGSLPWALYQREDDGAARRVDDHPLARLLVTPNADQTGVEFREAKITNLGLRGNGYSEIERTGSGQLIALRPHEACNVSPQREKSGRVFYEINENGYQRKVEQARMWHLKTFSRNGLTGLSPIGYARETLGLAMGLEEFGARIFANGLLSGAVIELPSWVPDDKRKLVEAKLQTMYTGLVNAGKPFLAEGGMKLSQGMLPPEDAQFLQLRGFGVDEICRFWRVPPHMVAKLDRATFSNIEQQSLDFVMYTILPYLTRIEQSASKWLLDAKDRGRFFLRFNFEGLLRADSAARAQLYSIMLQNGVLTRNEVRALENRNRLDIPEMDQPTVQSNMALLDQLAALVANTSRPPEPPAAKAADAVTNISMSLPSELKHKMATTIEVPGLREMAVAVKESNDNNRDAIELLRRDVVALTAKVEKSTEAALLPRRAVRDAEGNVLGSEAVESLH